MHKSRERDTLDLSRFINKCNKESKTPRKDSAQNDVKKMERYNNK